MRSSRERRHPLLSPEVTLLSVASLHPGSCTFPMPCVCRGYTKLFVDLSGLCVRGIPPCRPGMHSLGTVFCAPLLPPEPLRGLLQMAPQSQGWTWAVKCGWGGVCHQMSPGLTTPGGHSGPSLSYGTPSHPSSMECWTWVHGAAAPGWLTWRQTPRMGFSY